MRNQYKFSNLLGTVYRKGDLLFSNDGNCIYAPVGNKITCYDLHKNTSYTLPLEVKGNFTALALSPNGSLLMAATDRSSMHMISIHKKRVLNSKMYKANILSIKFSPDGKYFAFSQLNSIRVCSITNMDLFNPFRTEKVCDVATAEVTCISWSFDSRLVAFGSNDMLVRVFPVKHMDLGRQVVSLGGNSLPIQGVYFDTKSYNLYSVCKSSKIMYFNCSLSPDELVEKSKLEGKSKGNPYEDDEEEIMEVDKKPEDRTWLDFRCTKSCFVNNLIHIKAKDSSDTPTLDKVLNPETVQRNSYLKVTSSSFHPLSQVLVVACNSGDFAVLDSNLEVLHSYNASKQPISSICMNFTGDWVALGVSAMGQLLVYELKSETYVLKQQGHNRSMNVVAYAPDGSCLASGGDDGKVKLWSTVSSFCYVTFTEHKGAITGLAFTQSGKAILSSSRDGTVRAFDLTRYRNFKTLTSPKNDQFLCLAVDSSGELIAAGGQEKHEIYLWSLKLGTLLEVLHGHTGQVSGLDFSPIPGSTLLASTAWDQTVRVWDSINTTQAKETIRLHTDGLCVKIRPDGKQLAVSTMGGQITFFNVQTGTEEASIDGRTDLGLSRDSTDEITAEKNKESKFFETLCYSSDGLEIIGGGSSKHICVYDVPYQLLAKKYQITENRTFDGMLEVYNTKKLAKKGINKHLIERRTDKNDTSTDKGIKLPGVRKGDMSLRDVNPQIRVTDISFSVTGRSFVVCCTEGLLIYSQDTDWLFDPLEATVKNTPSQVKRKLDREEWTEALMFALRLNIDNVTQRAIETIPIGTVPLLVPSLPMQYVEKLLQFLARSIENTRHLGVYSRWARLTVEAHVPALKSRAPQIMTTLNHLQRVLHYHNSTIGKLCMQNQHTLAYLLKQSEVRKDREVQSKEEEKEEEEDKDSDNESDVTDMENLASNYPDDKEDIFGSDSENVSSDSGHEMEE